MGFCFPPRILQKFSELNSEFSRNGNKSNTNRKHIFALDLCQICFQKKSQSISFLLANRPRIKPHFRLTELVGDIQHNISIVAVKKDQRIAAKDVLLP